MSGYRWVVVAIAFATTALAVGTRGAFGVFLVPLADAFGWSRGLVAGAIAANAALWAVSAAPWGALLDRRGPRVTFGGAAALAGLGLLVTAATAAPWQLYLGVGVLAGAGLAPLQVNSQGVLVAHWFSQRRGLAMGLVAAGAGLGVLALAPLTQWLIDAAGWRVAAAALAALFLLGLAPLNAVLQRHRPPAAGAAVATLPEIGEGGVRPHPQPLSQRERRVDAPQSSLQGEKAAEPPLPARGEGPTVGMALRHPRFWLLAWGYLIGAVPVALLLAHSVAMLVDAGFAAPLASTVFGLSGACAVAGMLLLGWVADRWGGEWAYSAGSAALVLAMALLPATTPGQPLLLAPFAALFALGWASRQGLHAFMGAAIGQGRSLGALMGLLAAHTAAGSAIGPALGGWVYDTTGSYRLALVIGAACAAVAVVCVWAAAPRRGRLLGAAPPLNDRTAVAS